MAHQTMLPSFRIPLAACLALAPCWSQEPTSPVPVPDLRSDQASVLRTSSDLVVVDVVVRDKSGHPVESLSQSDFQVFEDKHEQTIFSFEQHGASTSQGTGTAPALPSSVYTNLPQYSTAARCVVLLDALNTHGLDLSYARTQLLKFLHTVPPGTQVALFVLGHDLRMIQGFTTDYAVLERVLSLRKSPTVPRTDSDSVQFGPNDSTDASAEADFDSALKVMDSMTKKAGVEETLAAFEELAHFLNAIPGRKSLIWFSGAFPLAIGDPTAIDDFQDFSGEIQEADNLLTSSRVSVYPVDARGIMTLPTARENAVSMRGTVSQAVHNDIDLPTGWSNQHRTMNEIANDTGGRAYYDSNAVGQSASQVIADSSKYYTLTYIPANPRHDEGFRKIEVKLKEEHYDLAYRRGYFGSRPNGRPVENLSTMAESMMHGAPQTSAITFEVQVLKGQGASQSARESSKQKPGRHYKVDFSIDPHHLQISALPDGHRQMKIEIAQAIFSLDGKRLNSTDAAFDSDLTLEQIRTAMQKGVLLHQEIDAPLDSAFLRLGIRDASSGKIGCIEIALPR
jgi:VWFA-related protein